jgi:hypothetical protein
MYSQIKLSTGLRNKFPMPESRFEQGVALFIIGLAILLAGAFDPLRDFMWQMNGNSADATLIKSEQYKNSGPKRLIGVYQFSSADGVFKVYGKSIYEEKAKIPTKGKVAWHLGEPFKARLLGDYPNRVPIIFSGFLVMLGGGYIIFKAKKLRAQNK